MTKLTCSVLTRERRGVVVEETCDEEEVVAVILDLRPLVGVEDVFEHQRMQLEAPADLAQHLGFVQAMHVEPELLPARSAGQAGGEAVEASFVEAIRAVFDERDRRVLDLLLTQMYQRAGGQPGLAGALGMRILAAAFGRVA